ncbi:MAG: hypothetical protein JNK45_07300 [Myxococcales bacterium]|nr:hypothetical protein [Myxococcales bacterium]
MGGSAMRGLVPGAAGVWLLLALAFGLDAPYFEQTRNANERPRVMQAMALVDAGEWAIDGPAVRGLEAGPDTARSKHDGRLYPNKPPGATLAAAVGYRGAVALAGPEGPTLREVTGWGRWVGGAIPTLLLAVVLWRRHAGVYGVGATMAAVLTWALATPAVVYAHLLYGHALAAMFLHVGITAVAAGIERDAARERWGLCALGGALAGSAVAVEYVAAFAAIPIGLVLMSRWRAHAGMPSAIAAALVGALVPVALLAAYHHAVFGSAFSTGYQHATVADFASKHGQGLLGLGWPTWHGISVHLLSPDGGLLWWAPLVVPGLYGLVLVARDDARRFEGRVHLGLVLLFLWINVSLSFEGGWRVGPRYFVLALPSFVLGWAELYAQTRTRAPWTTLLVGLGVYGVIVNGLAANLWPHLDLTAVDAPVAEVLLPLWRGDLRPYVGWGVVSGLRTDLVTVVVGASVIGFALVWARAVEITLRTSLALLGGLVLGVSLVGMHELLPRNPKAERNLAYIEKVWEPREQAGRTVTLPPLSGAAKPVQRVVPSRSAPQ